MKMTKKNKKQIKSPNEQIKTQECQYQLILVLEKLNVHFEKVKQFLHANL